MKTVCVTGHRPAKLPWGYKKEGPDYDEYIESLACTIADYLENGYDHFITGMALGVDMDFAETVIQFREHYDLDVKLECAIPCPNQTLKWSPAETDRYKQILEKADIPCFLDVFVMLYKGSFMCLSAIINRSRADTSAT